MLPRFQGSAIECEGGWTWELYVSIFGAGDSADKWCTHSVFTTKEAAIDDMKKAIHGAINHIAELNPELGIEPNQYIDLKMNATRKWDGSNEH